ncbi:MAG: hypothetical protein JWO21_1029 [Solirubrobacterales bacterium]|jgi:hypothetical protein|nr:hypothetical protein [Solirubrobacterales bacterium]
MRTKLICTLTTVATAILLTGSCGQRALGAARHATVVVHETFSARYGIRRGRWST